MYPACANAGDKIIAKSVVIVLCVRFLLPLSQQKAWSPNTSWLWCPHVQRVFGG
jgi:hypothetical protein